MSVDWFKRYLWMEQRALAAEEILRRWIPEQGINREKHMNDLEAVNKKLRHEIRNMQEVAEYRNRQLKAMNLIVYCNGGCQGGVPDPDSITEDVVAEVERSAARLRKWWENRQYRQARQAAEGAK